MNTTAVTELLAALARDIPALPGAACRGQPHLFDISDGNDRAAIAAAQACCARCPALTPCADWLATVPPRRLPWGVVAGRFVRPPRQRPLRDPKPKPPTKTDRAANWLADYLTDNGPVLSTHAYADAAATGIERHTLTRASQQLGVHHERANTGTVGGQRWWSLPYTTNRERNNTMMSDDDNPMLTDAELEALMPKHKDFMLAKIFVNGWALGQSLIFREALNEATKSNPTGFITALAEMLVRGYDLRDNQEALSAWWTDIELHQAAAATEKENPK